MSAISVIWAKKNEPPVPNLQARMLEAQTIYGRHRSFFWTGDRISLGGCMSNVLPEDRLDRQPLWSSDRSSCLVADVRLDNRSDLIRLLDLVHPEELSDSAVLMSAWERWGPDCLKQIIGAFAFAVWTPKVQELFAARDHTGERPLFYHRGEQLFALASMPKGLLTLPGLFPSIEESRVANWLACIASEKGKSFFSGVDRVPPGCLLRITPSSFKCERYWHPTDVKPIRYARDQDYAEALLEIFTRATEARLRTTKQIGSQLSAGLDSSSVTACAARLLSGQGKRLTAFTAIPRQEFNHVSEPWQIASEGEAAAQVAQLYPNIDHFLVDSHQHNLLETMKSWTNAMDEPVLNVVNVLWITAILKQARERGIDVMLEGAAGNCTISWEPSTLMKHFFRRGRWVKLLKTVHSLRNHGNIGIKAAVRSSLNGILPSWIDRRLLPENELQEFYSPVAHPEFVRRHDLESKIFKSTIEDEPDLKSEQSQYFEHLDFGHIHAAAQALTGVEVRDPTADKRVFEFCFSIPQEQYVVNGHSRSLIRRAMRGILPETTILRYKRGYQGADWYISMAEALPSLLEEATIMETSRVASETIDLPHLRHLLNNLPKANFEKKEISLLWHLALMRAISMGYFLRSHDSFAGTESFDNN